MPGSGDRGRAGLPSPWRSAPQVQIAARHMVLLEVNYFAYLDWQEARGTNREFDLFCKALQAQRELDAHEGRMMYLAYLKAEVKRRRAGQGDTGR